MNEGQEYEWHIELDHIKAQLHYALENLDWIPKRTQVRHTLQDAHKRISELADITKGESK